MNPAGRHRAVATLRVRIRVSERWACRPIGQHRSTQPREPLLAADDEALRAALRGFATDRPPWGYRRAHDQLLADAWEIYPKRVQRVWRVLSGGTPPTPLRRTHLR